MGAPASAASPTPEVTDPPAKGDVHPATAADTSPEEAAAPADSPAKEEILSFLRMANKETQPTASMDAPEGSAGETVLLESGEQEEEGECGFCVFMKDGGCGEEFVAWEKCVEAAEAESGDAIIERCSDAAMAMRRCMGSNPDYYKPLMGHWRPPMPMPDMTPALSAEGDDNKKQAEEAVVGKKEDAAA